VIEAIIVPKLVCGVTCICGAILVVVFSEWILIRWNAPDFSLSLRTVKGDAKPAKLNIVAIAELDWFTRFELLAIHAGAIGAFQIF
jgi:hypothetical protein